jgi:hypothetical protein
VTDLWWFGASLLVVYVGLGAMAAPGIVAKIDRAGRRNGRAGVQRLSSFLTATAMGRLVVVVLWPVLAWAAHWGFPFGFWDWKETSDPERRGDPSH